METTSIRAEWLLTLIDNADNTMILTLTQGSALQVIRREVVASAWFADLVADIVANDGGKLNEYRLEKLARLISLFGVGSVVNGRVRRSELSELSANLKTEGGN